MNPSSKRGFHMLLVLFKVLPSLLLRILGLGRNPNKTLGFWEQTNNHAIVWKTIPSFKSPCSSIPKSKFHTFDLSLLDLLPSSSSSSSSSSSLFLSSLPLYTVWSLKNERPICSYLIYLLRPCLAMTKTHFCFKFPYLPFNPITLLLL